MKREFTKLMAALALLLFIAPLGMWGQNYSLTPDQTSTGSSATSYIQTLTEFTYGGVSWKMNQWNPSTLQIKTNQNSPASEWRFYNTSAIPGKITQVVIKFSALTLVNTTNTGFMFVGGTSEVTATSGGTAGTWNSSAKTITWTPDAATNFTYFAFYQNGKVATGTNKLATSDAIVVTYTTPTATHTLTFAVNPSDAGSITAIDFSSGDVLAENGTLGVTATAEMGYTFANWSVTGTGSSVAAANNASTTFTMGTANTTLTANFTAVPTYTVTYHANVVGTADVEVEYNQGATVTVAANSFSNPGYAFTKWTTNADGTGTEYQPGDNIQNIQSNINLYAQWVVSNEVVDVLNREFTEIEEGATTYSGWNDKVGSSGAIYAGNSAGSHNSIQLRSNNNNSGIVTTTSGGMVKKVTVVWEGNTQSGRTLNVYGKNTAYSAATDLYGDNAGTLLGTIVCGTSTELVISGDYAYIGLRSASGAMYLSEIRITWESSDTPSIMVTPLSLNTFANLNTSLDASAAQSVSVSGSNLTDDITITVGNNSNFEISRAENSGYTNTITLSETEGTVSATTVYVRMKSGLSVGTYSGNLAITSTDASQVDIELNGNVAAVKTVPQAIAAIDAATGHIVTGAYVSGVVSYVEYYSTTNHYITYYISVDGNRENELEVFHGKNLNGTDFTAQSDLLVGDEVVIYGNLKLYDNTVYEFDADNYLISFNRPAAQEYTLTVSNLSHVNMFVFDAENQSDPLFEGEGTAQIYNGTNILLSVEVEEGYGIQSLIVDGVNVASQLDETGAYTFYMPTRNVTITATAAVLPAVILCDDNTTLYGATVTLPTRGNSGDYTFAGWCVTNYEEETTTTPTIIPVGNYQTTQQSIVLYPVYTRTEGGSGTATEWHLTELAAADAGVYAILSHNNYAFNGSISNENSTGGHGQATTDAFTFDGNGVATYVPAGLCEITFEVVEENGDVVGFKLHDVNNNRYLYASAATAGHLDWQSSENYYWRYDETNNNHNLIYNLGYSGQYARLRSYTSNYGDSFRTYQSNSGNEIRLAKKVGGTGTTYYTSLLTSLTKTITAPEGDRDSWYLIASPLVGTTNVMNVQNLINTNLNDFDLYRFDQAGDEDGNEWTNWKNNGALNGFNLEKGKGYLYANNTENDVVLTFTGTPYTGDGIVTLEKKDCSNASGNFEGWNLVGNPFAQTAYIDRDCYVMNSNRNQIVAGTSREVAAMEGVFVIAARDGETMTFSTTPLGKADSKVVMNVIDNQGVADRAIVRFGEGSQLPKFQLKGNATKVYFQQGQEEFAIVAAENEGELPVNFKASRNGRYTMSFDVENLDMNYLHLIDNKTGNDVDLLATPSYTFQANSSDYESRFRLVFDANTVNENNTTTTFAYFNGTEWVVNTTGNATLQVIDMMGRVLSSQTLSGNANVNINQPAGIYMLRLVNGENVKVQKVVVR